VSPKQKAIEEALARGAVIDQAAREGVRQALLRHKRLGESIVVWRDGKVVEIPAEEIQVKETPAALDRADPQPPEAA
jgi:hypothetical protein